MGIIVEQTSLIPPGVHRLGDDMVNFYIVEEQRACADRQRTPRPLQNCQIWATSDLIGVGSTSEHIGG
jgi:hypothetical protein